jgi:hypothetical protein
MDFADYSADACLVNTLRQINLWNWDVVVLTITERGLVLADHHHISLFQGLAKLVDKLINDIADLAAKDLEYAGYNRGVGCECQLRDGSPEPAG